MKILYVIPARGGSKGIPRKNIKPLNGKPLIYYSIDVARQLTSDDNICVSTDDIEIIQVVESYGLKVPFKRPDCLATDEATTNDVLLHVIDFYETKGKFYDLLVLLQPTSPLRNVIHVKEALTLYKDDLDMVVSVKESHAASLICKESENGLLEFCLNTHASRRQDMPSYFEYNGGIYIINVEKFKISGMNGLNKKKKYLMDEFSSIDIDTPLDWVIAESILKQKRSII